MSTKGTQWLAAELPKWEADGLVSPGQAEKLRARYAAETSETGVSWMLVVFGVLGALLVGLGIIALIAANWDDMPRNLRVFFAFLPLIFAGAIAVWTQWHSKTSPAQQEPLGIFWSLSVGAAIAIVAQIYNISSDGTSFYLAWALLLLPIIYITRSVGPTVGCWILLLVWAFMKRGDIGWDGGDYNATVLAFWPMAALALPVLFLIPARTVRAGWIRLMGTLVALVAIGASMQYAVPGLWIVVYAGTFGLLAQLDGTDENSFWKRPLAKVGLFGLLVLFFILTIHHDALKEFCRDHSYRSHGAGDGKPLSFDLLLTIGVLLPSVVTLTVSITRQRWPRVVVGAAVFVAAMAWWMASTGDLPLVAFWLCNAWLAAFGLHMLLTGVQSSSMKRINIGMLILLWAIHSRFFDSEFTMTVKGIVFILCGAGFLAANVVLARRFKKKGTSV